MAARSVEPPGFIAIMLDVAFLAITSDRIGALCKPPYR